MMLHCIDAPLAPGKTWDSELQAGDLSSSNLGTFEEQDGICEFWVNKKNRENTSFQGIDENKAKKSSYDRR